VATLLGSTGLIDRIAALSRVKKLLVLGVAAALVLSDAPQWTLDMMFNPWARADPPLLDEWAGTLTAGNDERLDVILVLERPEEGPDGGICPLCAQVEGHAVTCDASGRVRRYRVSGSPRDRRGRELLLGFSHHPDPPPDGLVLDSVSGTWDGADALTLHADFYWQRGRSAVSSSDDPATQPVPLAMGRQGTTSVSPQCAARASDLRSE
jgi:hypothetical protein